MLPRIDVHPPEDRRDPPLGSPPPSRGWTFIFLRIAAIPPGPDRAYPATAFLNRFASANMSTFVNTYVASLFFALFAMSPSFSMAGSS